MTNLSLRFLMVLFGVVVILMAGLAVGSVTISPDEIWQCVTAECQQPINDIILWDLRLPRVLMAFVAGGGLAVAGAMLQNATNNQLADPYLFGIVSGAGLGAVIFSVLAQSSDSIGTPISASIGAIAAIVLVMTVVMKNRLFRPEHIILAGVAVSFMLAAVLHFVLFVAEPLAANRIIFWLMGSVATASYESVLIVFVPLLICVSVLLLLRHQIDALLLGDVQAETLGVNVNRMRFLLLLITAIVTAVTVAFCGGIGFIGLMVPHIVRNFAKGNTGTLVPLSLVVGGCFLVVVDLIARTAMVGQEMPLGVITSALGSVFFLLVLKRSRHG
ncbi:FecCD family ABC transporter permease [Psychrosphaera ytuae]|nr:iron ABC transporter permease [Psychrosphaera ytuae]